MNYKPSNYTASSVKLNPGLWDRYLPIGLPILLGLILGLIVAFLIASGNWLFAFVIVFGLPMAILLNRYPFLAIILWMGILPFFPFTDEYKLVYWPLHRMLLPMALGVHLLARFLKIKEYPPVRLGLAEMSMFAFGIFALFSILLFGSSITLILKFYDHTLIPFMTYLLVRFLSPREADLKRLIMVMLFLCLAEAIIGLLSWFIPQAIPEIWHNRFSSRIIGTLWEPGAYAAVLLFLMVFLFHDAMSRKNSLMRNVLLLTFGIGMVAVFFTFTRSCWLAGVLAVIGLMILYPKPTLSLTGIILFVMVVLGGNLLAKEFEHAFLRLNDEDTADDRIVMAHAGQELFLASPIIGWGYGNYDRYDWKYMERVGNVAPTKWVIKRGTSHNTYLTILAETGMVGFTLYHLPFIFWLVVSFKIFPQLPKRGFWSWRLLAVMWLAVGAFLVISLFIDMRFFLFPLTTVWLTLGLIANFVYQYLYPETNCESTVTAV